MTARRLIKEGRCGDAAVPSSQLKLEGRMGYRGDKYEYCGKCRKKTKFGRCPGLRGEPAGVHTMWLLQDDGLQA